MSIAQHTRKDSVLDVTTVGEAMHVGLVTCPLETPLTEVARLMAEHRIHSVIGFGDLADDDTRLWGVVTDGDLMAVAAGGRARRLHGGRGCRDRDRDDRGRRAVAARGDLMREHQVSHLLVGRTLRRQAGRRDLRLDVARIIGGGRPTPTAPGSRVEHLMSSPVVTVSPDTPLREVAALLVERGISGSGRPWRGGRRRRLRGRHRREGAASGVPASAADGSSAARHATTDRFAAATAGEAMTSPAITISAWQSASAAAALMVEHGVKRLPVTRQNRLIGVITRSDLVRAFARSDSDLERDIRSILSRTIWLEPGAVLASVRDGKATLTGVVDSTFDAELLVRAVERVPGVLHVDGRLTPREGRTQT